ncbi:MAG: hypothetical protein OdinLCB4_000040 [Candidatus Odinarchaeum yellowstonii]|uniref:Uncharacterized protein n=1 Tax=Odinarchaeota yellowstonii (strain LCB_4) TaxID=1841599 RepID=A0AAF0IBG7_ODILC|nr:MAG: hypothetical protein OdinLCB4_000040 [Candidatus Odinarchaeum yellowstonii]
MKNFKKKLENIIIFLSIYFLILIPLNLIPMIAAYGLKDIETTLNTILMIGSFNIYTFIAYSIVSGFSAGTASYLIRDGETSITASTIIVIIISSCSIILDTSLQFPLLARITIISIIVCATLIGLFCNKFFADYNKLFK